MDQLTQALDEIESAAASGTGDLLATYAQIRPHLEQIVTTLAGQGGDMARVGLVIENLMAGADSLGSGAPAGGALSGGQSGSGAAESGAPAATI